MKCYWAANEYSGRTRIIVRSSISIDATFVPSGKPSSKPTLLDTVYRVSLQLLKIIYKLIYCVSSILVSNLSLSVSLFP